MNETLKKIDGIITDDVDICLKLCACESCLHESKDCKLHQIVKEIIQADKGKDINVSTKGSLIRESNESLSKFITTSYKQCQFCIYDANIKECNVNGCKVGILAYFNQKVVE